MRLNKEDKVPYLEVIIEMENDKIIPLSQFTYLHPVEETMDLNSLDEGRVNPVEKLEWAENIGKTYIRLDFDRSKK